MKDKTIPSIFIESIEFSDGNTIEFNSDDIVLLVGANNVGKSRTLKDLQQDLIDYRTPKILVKNINYQAEGFSAEIVKSFFERNFSKDSDNNYSVAIDNNHTYCFDKYCFENIDQNFRDFYKCLFSYLSTENRLNITKPIKFNMSVDRGCLNILSKLEESTDAISILNNFLAFAFKKSIDVYQYYENDSIVKEYKIGDNRIIYDAINSNGREEKKIIKDLEGLCNQGDGIRSAVAILSSLIVNEHSLFLVDEPETFLHPPQAKLIAKNIVNLSNDKQCFIATHNIDFIKGIVEENSSRVKIIKIDRKGNKNYFNLINNDSITEIANDKNLKYTNLLDGLFYNRLVLCENESDCKFYSAILENLDPINYQNTLFCAVGGKEQFKKIIPLLRELSIQYFVIADIDLIDNKDSLKQLLNSCEIDCYENIRQKHEEFLRKFIEKTNDQVKTQEEIKREINNVFNQDKYLSTSAVKKIRDILKTVSCFKLLKKGGKNILPQGECISLFNDIKKYLNEHNIFILECGEVERFVPDVSGHGNEWVERTFDKYSDIGNSVYNEAKSFITAVFRIDN